MGARPFIGLSATPWTRGLGKHYDDLIIAATTADLIERRLPLAVRRLCAERTGSVRRPHRRRRLSRRRARRGVDKRHLVGDVIDTWLTRGENRPTLCYGVNRAHAEHLQQRFLEAGVAAEYIDCFTDRPERERIFDRFRAGETRIICNVATLADRRRPATCRCIIDARPTKSEMRFVQTIGRGLRTAPGKDRLIILDHAGNHPSARPGDRHSPRAPGRRRTAAPRNEPSAARRCRACAWTAKSSCRASRPSARSAAMATSDVDRHGAGRRAR